jgi:hypothetical protein
MGLQLLVLRATLVMWHIQKDGCTLASSHACDTAITGASQQAAYAGVAVLQMFKATLLHSNNAVTFGTGGDSFGSCTVCALTGVHAAGCRDVLAPVAPYVAWLAQLEAASKGNQQSQQDRLEAVAATKDCLLAIGERISGGEWWPSWTQMLGLTAPGLWKFVAAATEHRMAGEQLARLCAGMQKQHGAQQAQGAAGRQC